MRTMEKILEKLTESLRGKRLDFPRFFFVSDEDLLTAFSGECRGGTAQWLVSKCFAHAKELHTDGDAVLGLVSYAGEVFSLDSGPRITRKPDEWMQELQLCMARTVRSRIQAAVGSLRQDHDPVDILLDRCVQWLSFARRGEHSAGRTWGRGEPPVC